MDQMAWRCQSFQGQYELQLSEDAGPEDIRRSLVEAGMSKAFWTSLSGLMIRG